MRKNIQHLQLAPRSSEPKIDKVSATFTTAEGIAIKPRYTAGDLAGFEHLDFGCLDDSLNATVIFVLVNERFDDDSTSLT